MNLPLVLTTGTLAISGSLFFSTISYALRDFSRLRLQERMNRLGKQHLFETIADHAADLIFVTAFARLLSNILFLICVLRLFHETHHSLNIQYLLAVLVAAAINLLTSVAIPNAAAKYAGETFIAFCAELLQIMRVVLLPVIKIMHFVDDIIRRAAGADTSPQPEQIDEEILSAVEEGEKEGVVDENEREMIESVIELRDITVGQIMTARPDVVAIGLPATLDEIKQTIEQSAHSRIPVFEGTLDHIAGVLYARDLLRYIGEPADKVDVKSVLRTALFVPESKPVRDLLADFRLQKVHMAIVLDEYGGTTGLVTIEDIIEELVGDISDEHEPAEPALLNRLNDHAWEADARIPIEALNRSVGLSLPEDAGIETLGGFISTTLGSIPQAGAVFEHEGAKFIILDAEPQRVNRVRIELPVQLPVPDTTPAEAVKS